MDTYVVAAVIEGSMMVYSGDVTSMGMTFPTFTDDFSGAVEYDDYDTAHAVAVRLSPIYYECRFMVCTLA